MGGVFLMLGTFVGFILSHINFWTIGKGFKIELLSINPKFFSFTNRNSYGISRPS